LEALSALLGNGVAANELSLGVCGPELSRRGLLEALNALLGNGVAANELSLELLPERVAEPLALLGNGDAP
jgi:hypothetical protein